MMVSDPQQKVQIAVHTVIIVVLRTSIKVKKYIKWSCKIEWAGQGLVNDEGVAGHCNKIYEKITVYGR